MLKRYLPIAAVTMVAVYVVLGLIMLAEYSLPVGCYDGVGSPCPKSFWQK